MKVAIVSLYDWAYAGGHIALALRSIGVDATCYVINKANPFKYPHYHPRPDELETALESCDKMIYKGDEPIHPNIEKLRKPDIHLVEGTSFRRFSRLCPETARPRTPLSVYQAEIDRGIKLAAVSPDLFLGVDLPMIYMPLPFPKQAYIWRWGKEQPLHIPSDPRKKGTDKLRRYPIEIRHGMTWKESLNMKQWASSYVDQIATGWYGLAAIEAGAFGVPVMVYIDPLLKEFYNDIDCPYIQIGSQGQEITDTLRKLSQDKDYAEMLSAKTYAWTKQFHGQEEVGRRWLTLLK